MNRAHKPSSSRILSSELGLRVVSAIVLIVIVVAAAWAGGTAFKLICAVLSALVFYEWQMMVSRTPFNMPEAVLTGGFGLMLLAALFGGFGWALALFVVLGLALELTHHGRERSEIRWIGIGALYCIIAAIALPAIREVGGFLGIKLIFFLFLLVWVTDIAAYFTGRSIGGPKILPAISPKKTWSGSIGGMLGAIVVGALFGIWVDEFAFWTSTIAAAVLSVTAQAGDFFESWVKRLHGVKDSSHLIPGHGGFLDRVDGLIAAALPVAVVVGLNQAV
jgi:phosphatidate cytidylyltransferase